jgi:catechol 2,3-dioxygenase-like lactoylglutathione lyase family enzyme
MIRAIYIRFTDILARILYVFCANETVMNLQATLNFSNYLPRLYIRTIIIRKYMRVHHIAISVKDLKNSTKFYKENFGFKEIKRFTKPGWDGNAIVLKLGGMQLELFHFKNQIKKKDDLSNFKVLGLKHIGIEVSSVHDKFKKLKNKGLDIDEPVKGVTCSWFCFLRDPDGIPIELYESK